MNNDIQKLSLDLLRKRWAVAWGKEPPARVGRSMLERSLAYKFWEQSGQGLTVSQKKRLAQLIKRYKRNPNCFDEGHASLKPGTRLIRNWKGERHSVLVKAGHFEYNDKTYTSLSQIANDITGSRWNGHLFFGLKNKEAA